MTLFYREHLWRFPIREGLFPPYRIKCTTPGRTPSLSSTFVIPMKKMIRKAKVPYFVIGGINRGTIGKVKDAGACAVAVCGAVITAENPLKETRAIKKVISTRKGH